MLHKRSSILTLLILALLTCSLAACKAKELPDEPYTAVDYNLYPAPQDAYVGDTMPFVTDDGTLELYYLYDTDHNGMGYHPVYKYSTKDLCSYEDHGKVLDFGQLSDPDPAIGTGSVMQDQDGLYHLFYTGHNDTGNGGKGKECVMHATSTDRENWVKIPEDTFYSPDNYSKDDFRDPEVFWAVLRASRPVHAGVSGSLPDGQQMVPDLQLGLRDLLCHERFHVRSLHRTGGQRP